MMFLFPSRVPYVVSRAHLTLGQQPQRKTVWKALFATMASSKTPDIDLYTTQTPNGIKISIALEELGCELMIFPCLYH
jgi:hypothetical protein